MDFHRRRPEAGVGLLYLVGGAIGGFAAGLLIGGVGRPLHLLRRAGRMVPDRLRRGGAELGILAALEDRVLEAYLDDEILRERGIDIGAISRGIIELSGLVRTREEVERAVRVASLVPGVSSVLNRLDAEEENRQYDETRRRFESDDVSLTEWAWTGRGSGMGRRRQSPETEPPRRDDSRWLKDRALDEADRDQWQEEGLAAHQPHLTERTGRGENRTPTRYSEDELDHQDPHRQSAGRTRGQPPGATNPQARVGEGVEPGTELRLEDADVPLKPHSDGFRTRKPAAEGDEADGPPG
jgi:hypothetical protein